MQGCMLTAIHAKDKGFSKGSPAELQQETELTKELTCDKRQPLNAIKVSVLNGHDTSICKDLFREVVDELAVDEAVKALADDVLHLGAHLLLLCLLYVCNLHRQTPGIMIAVLVLRKTQEVL
jgi:hypothetical protein